MSAHDELPETRIAAIVRGARVVAVVGMKDERSPDAPAFTVPASMKARGIRVVPVNPTIASSLGEPALPRVAFLAEKVDVIQIFRRADAVSEVAAEILALPPERRPPVVWMQTGIVNADAAKKLEDAGIDVVMDRCFAVDAARYRR